MFTPVYGPHLPDILPHFSLISEGGGQENRVCCYCREFPLELHLDDRRVCLHMAGVNLDIQIVIGCLGPAQSTRCICIPGGKNELYLYNKNEALIMLIILFDGQVSFKSPFSL